MKKLSILFLALALSTGIILAESGSCGGQGLHWDLTDGVLTISGGGSMYDYDTGGDAAAPWDKYKDRITLLIIGDDAWSIGKRAFSACGNLTSAIIGKGIMSIGDKAFWGCSGLTSVTINSNYILHVDYAESSNLCTIFGKQVKEYIIGSNVYSIGSYAFYGCTGLTSIEIPNSVTSIGNYAFSYCSGLTSVTIPNSVTNIGSWAFSVCKSLTTISIPNSVTSIGNSTFSYCSGLTSVIIPNSVTSIGAWAFEHCTGLTSITIPNGVTSIRNYAFRYCTGLTSIEIPNSVTSIGVGPFSSCSNLTTIDVSTNNSNYCSVSGVLFNKSKTTLIQYPCAKQGAYTIPNSVTCIGSYAFIDCTGLTSIEIPNSVTSIGDYAFESCYNLTSLIIPNSVTSIEDKAFSICVGLTSITCEAVNPPILGSSVFQNINKSIPLYVPAESIAAYKAADKWKDFYNISPIDSEEKVNSFDGFEANNTLADQINNENLIQDLVNVTIVQTPNQNYKHTINLINGGEGTFKMGGVTFSYTNSEAGKIAYKTYNNYIQPNGFDREIRIPTYSGQQFKITLVEACDGILIDGVSTNLVAGENIITASKDGTTITNPSNKPKIAGILPIGGLQYIYDVQEDQKSIVPRKVMIDGQIYILCGEKIYTMQGQEL